MKHIFMENFKYLKFLFGLIKVKKKCHFKLPLLSMAR